MEDRKPPVVEDCFLLAVLHMPNYAYIDIVTALSTPVICK